MNKYLHALDFARRNFIKITVFWDSVLCHLVATLIIILIGTY